MLHRNVQTAKITAVLCLLCMFVLSGIHKIMHFDTTVKSLVSKVSYWPLPKVSIILTILLEILCPLIIIYSLIMSKANMARKASVLTLLIFTITVTIIYHPLKLKSSYMKNIPFFSNLSLIGGLTLLLLQ